MGFDSSESSSVDGRRRGFGGMEDIRTTASSPPPSSRQSCTRGGKDAEMDLLSSPPSNSGDNITCKYLDRSETETEARECAQSNSTRTSNGYGTSRGSSSSGNSHVGSIGDSTITNSKDFCVEKPRRSSSIYSVTSTSSMMPSTSLDIDVEDPSTSVKEEANSIDRRDIHVRQRDRAITNSVPSITICSTCGNEVQQQNHLRKSMIRKIFHAMALFFTFVAIVALWGSVDAGVSVLAAHSPMIELLSYGVLLLISVVFTATARMLQHTYRRASTFALFFSFIAAVSAWGVVDVLVDICSKDKDLFRIQYYFLFFFVSVILVSIHTCLIEPDFKRHIKDILL